MNDEGGVVVVVAVRNLMASVRSISARFRSHEDGRRGMDRDRLRSRGDEEPSVLAAAEGVPPPLDLRRGDEEPSVLAAAEGAPPPLDLRMDPRSARRGSVRFVPEKGSVWTVSSSCRTIKLVVSFCMSLLGEYSSRLNPSFVDWVVVVLVNDSRVFTFLFNSESELCRTMVLLFLSLSTPARW